MVRDGDEMRHSQALDDHSDTARLNSLGNGFGDLPCQAFLHYRENNSQSNDQHLRARTLQTSTEYFDDSRRDEF